MKEHDLTISDWGTVMRLARAATKKALEVEKDRLRELHDEEQDGKFKFAELSYTGLLYTDDPTTASLFAVDRNETADVCGLSDIEGVGIVMGENFPPASTEAERDDPELPRVAVLLLKSPRDKCERCRKFIAPKGTDICARCAKIVEEYVHE